MTSNVSDFAKAAWDDYLARNPERAAELRASEAKHRAECGEMLSELKRNPSASAAQEYLRAAVEGGSAARPLAFLALHRNVFPRSTEQAGAEFWRWVANEWSGFDAIPHATFQRQFSKWRLHWDASHMPVAERRLFESLPRNTTIYRGQRSLRKPGLSWTLDRTVAEGFARGHRGMAHPHPLCLKRHAAPMTSRLCATTGMRVRSCCFLPRRASGLNSFAASRPPDSPPRNYGPMSCQSWSEQSGRTMAHCSSCIPLPRRHAPVQGEQSKAENNAR